MLSQSILTRVSERELVRSTPLVRCQKASVRLAERGPVCKRENDMYAATKKANSVDALTPTHVDSKSERHFHETHPPPRAGAEGPLHQSTTAQLPCRSGRTPAHDDDPTRPSLPTHATVCLAMSHHSACTPAYIRKRVSFLTFAGRPRSPRGQPPNERRFNVPVQDEVKEVKESCTETCLLSHLTLVPKWEERPTAEVAFVACLSEQPKKTGSMPDEFVQETKRVSFVSSLMSRRKLTTVQIFPFSERFWLGRQKCSSASWATPTLSSCSVLSIKLESEAVFETGKHDLGGLGIITLSSEHKKDVLVRMR